MSWFEATIPHDKIRVGEVVWLDDTKDVALRVAKGFLLSVEEPDWNSQLPEDKQWPRA